MTTILNLLTPPTNQPKGTAGNSAKKSKRLTIVQMVIRMFKRGGRIPALIGMLTEGCMPAITFCVAHLVLPFCREFSFTFRGRSGVIMWAVVLLGQLCSAPKGYKWFLEAYGSRIEAFGAVMCLELTMTFVPIPCVRGGPVYTRVRKRGVVRRQLVSLIGVHHVAWICR